MNEDDSPPAADDDLRPTLEVSRAGAPGLPFDTIGPYRLIESLGQGGMGEVFIAEQTRPIRRQVALKVIRPGMDSREVVARFEAERQALAMMDHPYIARVFDAGATEQGRPYFAMEYIRGLPITDFCDRRRLTLRQRLELFIQVAEGVQHAHQKGIIHRDLKPSNILVTEGDPPTPRIIDFGVAKATAQRLTEHSMFTAIGQMVGTPEYMAPEQADPTREDIDTRADVYALGMVLYELLTGVLPFETRDFRKAGYDAMLKMIREVEAPPPSTRVGSLGAGSDASAQNRQTESGRLRTALRGDLDWITMKALEKERARRYDSVGGLALDVRRHLDGEAVLASPPSATYRLQKLVRRHRAAFAALAAILVVLAAATVVSTSLFFRAREESARARKEAARSSQIAAFMKSMLTGVGPSVAMGRDTKMLREILDSTSTRIGRELGNQPEVEADIRDVLASTYLDLGDAAQAETHQKRAVALFEQARGARDTTTLAARTDLGVIVMQAGRMGEAESLLVRNAAIAREVTGEASPLTLTALNAIMNVYTYQTRSAEAESLGLRVVPLMRRTLGDGHEQTQAAMFNLASTLADGGRFAEAESLFLPLIAALDRKPGPDHVNTLTSKVSLGWAYQLQGRFPEAERLTREALERERRVLGNEHPTTLVAVNNLGVIYNKMERYAEAEPLFIENVETGKRTMGEKHPETLAGMVNLASFYLARKQFERAVAMASQCITTFTEVAPPDFFGKGLAFQVRGESRLRMQDYAGAERDLQAGYDIIAKNAPPGSPRLQRTSVLLAEVSDRLGKTDQAAEWRARAGATK